MTRTNFDRRSIWSDLASTRHPQNKICLEGKTRRQGRHAEEDNAKRNQKMKATHQLTSKGPAAREVIGEDNVLGKSKVSMAAGSSIISKHNKAK
jgi:hypothetical protein